MVRQAAPLKPQFPPQLPGFDLEAAVRRVNGKWDRLRKLLISFAETNREANGVLRSLLEEAEFAKARDLLHQIKGSAANLGAVALAAAAAELENLLKAGETTLPSPLLDEFALCVGQLAEAECVLKAMDADGDIDQFEQMRHSIRGANVEDIESCLQTIATCLRSDISRVEDEIDVLLAHCRGSEMEELAVHIQNEFNAFNIAEISRSINQYFVSAR